MLHIPAALHELSSEPIKQLAMRRDLALNAEVFRGLHEAHAEDRLPEAIHRHASGERILAAHEPLREAEAGARSVFGPVAYTDLRADETGLDLVCRILHDKIKKPTFKPR